MNVDLLLAEMKAKILSIGIPVSEKIDSTVNINFRAKSRLGCCIFKDGKYTIEVSVFILDDMQMLIQTIAHELLHTCPDCGNHGAKWKSYAAKTSSAFGLSISRTAPIQKIENENHRKEKVNYILVCKSCGMKIQRKRMSNVIKYPYRYRCKCGGKLEVFHLK